MAVGPACRMACAFATLLPILACAREASQLGSPFHSPAAAGSAAVDSATVASDADAATIGGSQAQHDVAWAAEATAAQDAQTVAEVPLADAQQFNSDADMVAQLDAPLYANADAAAADCGPPPLCQIWASTDTPGVCTPKPDPA